MPVSHCICLSLYPSHYISLHRSLTLFVSLNLQGFLDSKRKMYMAMSVGDPAQFGQVATAHRPQCSLDGCDSGVQALPHWCRICFPHSGCAELVGGDDRQPKFQQRGQGQTSGDMCIVCCQSLCGLWLKSSLLRSCRNTLAKDWINEHCSATQGCLHHKLLRRTKSSR